MCGGWWAAPRERRPRVTAAAPQLSPRMVQFAHAVLRNALSNAVREELVSRNAAELVTMSGPEYDVGAGLDPIAARALLAQIADDRLYRAVPVRDRARAASGELLGLTWDAVDLDGGRLAVRQALSWVERPGGTLATAEDPGVPAGDPAARRRRDGPAGASEAAGSRAG